MPAFRLCAMESETVCGNDLTITLPDSIELRLCRRPPNEALAEVIADADGLWCSKAPITAEVMDACPNLRYIGLTATGYNNVDVAAAAARGITVTNIPDYSTNAVAQMTAAYLLQFATNLIDYVSSTRRGDWTRSPFFCYFPYPLTELCGKTLGIFGLGAIGKRVAVIGEALGMKILYHSRTKKDVPYEFVSREELFSRSDFLTLHLPLSADTEKMIDKKALSSMKPSAYLINTARGGLIDEDALAEALKNKTIAGFAGDVLTLEPQRADCPLTGLENCYLTPHVAWAPKETRERLLSILTENLLSYLKGCPIHCVTPPFTSAS